MIELIGSCGKCQMNERIYIVDTLDRISNTSLTVERKGPVCYKFRQEEG